MQWIESLWHFVFGWPTVAVVVGIIATAIAILEPKQLDAITDLRKWAIGVAVIAFSFTAIAGKFYNAGLSEKQRQWNAALVAETSAGNKARSDAVDTVRRTPLGSVLRSDPANRDNWSKSHRD